MEQDWDMLQATQESLSDHMRLLSWLKHHCDKGQVQIARSLLGTGYEVAIVPRQGKTFVKAYSGDFGECITQAMHDVV
jgi:hypothetical protein